MKKYLILLILIIGIFIWWQIYLPKAFDLKEIMFRIEKGEGSKEIASNLQESGLIRWGPVFRTYVLITGASNKLQAGTYLLSPSMNLPVITQRFATGDIAKEKITIIEGWNLRDIGFYFENKGMFQVEELWELVGFPLDPKSQEGYLFPDTYEVNLGDPLEKIVDKMLENFDKKTANLEITHEIIIMASLLEREVKTKEDKKLVAGVLWKRLRAGIPLQVDATINYFTGERNVKISKNDTQIDSPYNTYLYYGLPAGPISNPGLESIEAAVHPQDNQYWYYLSTPEGETIFSKTLEEHNIAKARYLK